MSSSQGTGGSSIASWLDAHPNNPREYNSITEQPKINKHNRLYTRKNWSNKRSKLGEMSHNTRTPRPQQDSARKLDDDPAPANSNTPNTPGPSKRRSRRMATKVSAKQSSTLPVAPLDEELTSKPKSASTIPQQDSLWPLPILGPYSSSPIRSASKTASSSRSSSPTKRLGDFRLSDVHVEMITIGTPGYPIPSGVKDLYRDLRSISSGQGVVPVAVKDRALATYEEFLQEWNFGPSDTQDAEQLATRGHLGHHAFWERAHEILDAALECRNKQLAEPSWNSEVHSSLLRLALRGWWQSKDIWYCDITTAKIHDKDLLPTMATGATMQSKMVDYALVLEQPSDLNEGIIDTLRAENRPSINHTEMEAVRFSPIAVSIETKRGAVDEDAANVQLGMWVSAHFARLRQLTSENGPTELPVLPLVIVQGFAWKVMFAEARAGTRGAQHTLIYNSLRLGDTDSILGIYQVMEAVRRLARWVDEDYRPWFKTKVLGMS